MSENVLAFNETWQNKIVGYVIRSHNYVIYL